MERRHVPQLEQTLEHPAVIRAVPAWAHMRERIEATANVVRKAWGRMPDVALVLGTGLGGIADEMQVEATIDYADLPGFPLSTVESHAGRLLCGSLAGSSVVVMQGRAHRYEGYSLQQVTFPVRVMHALGARTLFVFNACGGLHPLWSAGDLMLIADHINLLGDSPLVGLNDDTMGPRFPDMTVAYDAELRALARSVAAGQGTQLREGVYVAVTGPSLETRAEYRMLRAMGADVVGMSTVPEVTVARHAGMRVLGISVITDMCLPDALEPVDPRRVLSISREAEPRLNALVRGTMERM